MIIPHKTILCLSGGMDSVTLLYELHKQGVKIHCALFDYHQRHVQELVWAKHHCGKLDLLYNTIEVPDLVGSQLTDGKGGWVVPNRNMVLLSLAVNLAVEAEADSVTYACNKDDAAGFPDCRHAFIDAMNETLKAAEIAVEICAPYIGLTKWQIAQRAKELDVNLNETWSCYQGGKKPCGKCPACEKRSMALK